MVSSRNKGPDEHVPDGALDEDVPMSEILAAIRKSIADPDAETGNTAAAAAADASQKASATPDAPDADDEDVLDLSVEVGPDGQPLPEPEPETLAVDEEVEAVEVVAQADAEPEELSKSEAETEAEADVEEEPDESAVDFYEAADSDEDYKKAVAALRASASTIEEDLVTFEMADADAEGDQELEAEDSADIIDSEEPELSDPVDDNIEAVTDTDSDMSTELQEDSDEVVSLASLINEDEIAEYLANESKKTMLEKAGVGGPSGSSDDYSVSLDDDPRFAARSSDPRNRAKTAPYLRSNEVDDSDPFSGNIPGGDVDSSSPFDHAVPSDDERFIPAGPMPGHARHAVTHSPDMPDPRLTGHGVVPHEGEPTAQSALSHAGADATSSAFEQLARGITSNILPESSAGPGGYTTVETFVADLLRPLLSEWLDEHLPEMVEKALKEELDDRLED
jgi:uncharacterized protein